MHLKQTIAVIGATGNMGKAISKTISKTNFRLLISSRDFIKTKLLADEILSENNSANIEAIDCSINASWEADIIILAVPFQEEKGIADRIKNVANQKIVISISNPINDSYTGLLTAPNSSTAEELQQQLPHSKIIKAFNSNFAADFYNPIINDLQVDSFIAGNNLEALQEVADLVSAIGFNPIIAGDLTVSRTLENMQLLLIQLGMKYQYNWHAGWKILHN